MILYSVKSNNNIKIEITPAPKGKAHMEISKFGFKQPVRLTFSSLEVAKKIADTMIKDWNNG